MSAMLRKKEVFTIITPIPGFIPRQLAIDILHSHSEVITLNPLVLEHKPIPAPRNAASDEFYSTWYEITERIQYIPGMGKMGSGKISFNGCFHNMPWGLQTHVYAPMNVDLRNTYRIAGNQPGVEPPEVPEIGISALGAPADGLYLREDIEIKCNITIVSFVKSQLKAASKQMVQRIIKKAELLDAGVLQAMIQDGKLKTVNPNDRSESGVAAKNSMMRAQTGLTSSGSVYQPSISPRLAHQGSLYGSPRPGHTSPQPSYYSSQTPPLPGSQQQGASGHYDSYQQQAPIEMPGDYYHPQQSPGFPPPQPSPHFQPNRDSRASNFSHTSGSDPRWSSAGAHSIADTNRSSMTSDTNSTAMSAHGGYSSPGLDQKAFAAELPSHPETREEHGSGRNDTKQPPSSYTYNPRDYANVRG